MDNIIKYRKIFLGLVILLTIFFASGLRYIQIDYDFDSFFSKNDTSYIEYKQWSNEFKINQHCLINVAFEQDHSVYKRPFLLKADSVFNQIAQINGISKSYFFTNLIDYKRSLLGATPFRLVNFQTDEQVLDTRKKQQDNKWLFNNFISKDEKNICGFFYIDPYFFNLPKRDSICNSIENVLQKSNLKHHIYGMPYVRTEFSKKIINDFFFFALVSLLLLIIFLFYIFRDFYLIFTPFLAIVIGIVWTFGLMGWLGHSVNMITNMLIPIIFVVGVSDSIHIITAFVGNLKTQIMPKEAIGLALKEVGIATSLTAIVSAVGFLSLAITDIQAIKTFGMYGFFGIASTFIISIILIPNILLRVASEKMSHQGSLINSAEWSPFFKKIYKQGFKFQKAIVLAVSIILLISLFFASKIPTNMYFLDDVGRHDKLWHSLHYFEKQFSGFKPFEVIIETKDNSNVTITKNLVEIEQLQDFLKKTGKFSDFVSVVNVLKYSNYVYNFNSSNSFILPKQQQVVDFLLNVIPSSNDFNIITADKKSTMISARMVDLGSEETQKMENIVNQYLSQKSSNLKISFTGFGHILDKSNTTLRSDILISVFIDLLVISLIMAFLFKSFRYILISIIPNLIPLIITAGIMGFLEIPMSPSNAIVFVIIFGISIDDTIHFLTHYLLLRKKTNIAIWLTLDSTGKAMTIVSFILMAGVGSLCFSDFGAIFSIGLFGLVTIIFATLSEFFITPILIRVLDKQTT